MLTPRKVKHRKHQKGTLRSRAKKGTYLSYGSYGLKAKDSSWVSARQIEAARQAMTRFVKRDGKIWIRIFPSKPITKKGTEVGMGKGKGSVDHFVAVVETGRILFEMDGISQERAKEALRLAGRKLPIKTKFVAKGEIK